MKCKLILLVTSALASSAVLMGTAHAAAGPDGVKIGEVVVTAQKRVENVQSIPLAVTPVAGAKLIEQGVTDVRELGHLVPGIILGQDYIYTQIDIRGVGANNDAPALDPAVAFNIDGIYQARDYGTYGSFYDIQRVEVLRGPQGTLYGRNATGGSINLVTNKPVDSFHAAAEADFGNYALIRTSAMLNIPLAKGFAIRGAFQQAKHDGYLSSGFNDQDSIAGRLQALITPNDDFSLLVAGDYFRDNSTGAHTIIGLPYQHPADPWFDPLAPKTDDHSTFRSWSTHAQLDWTFGGITLTEIPAYKRVDVSSKDPVVGVYSSSTIRDTSFSNELRLANDATSRLKWVAGFYYFKEDDFSSAQYANPFFRSITINPDIAEKSWAAFGQATYGLSDSVRVTGGLRYSRDTKSANGQNQVFIPAFTFPVGTTPDDFPETTWGHLDWRVGLDADVGAHTLVYANVATGYLEGGFNLGSRIGLLPNFNPEKLIAYSAGAKNTFWDGRAQLNLEAFYYDYKDYVVSVFLTQGSAAGQFALFNTPAKIYGAEVESIFRLTPHDTLDANLSLLHGRYGDFTQTFISTGLHNLSGQTLMRSPSATIQAGYEHVFDLPGGATLKFGVQTHYEASYWTLFDHTPGTLQPSYTKTNAVLTYTAADGRWHVQGYVNNIENAAVIATAAPPNAASGGVIPWLHIEEPRVFGVRVGANF